MRSQVWLSTNIDDQRIVRRPVPMTRALRVPRRVSIRSVCSVKVSIF